MSDPAAFIGRLRRLGKHDLGAVAALRRSLAYDPGTDVRAFPFVEEHIPAQYLWGADSWGRRAYYLVAGLWASVNTASVLASAATGDEAAGTATGDEPTALVVAEVSDERGGQNRRAFGYAVAQLRRQRDKTRGAEQSDAARSIEQRFIALLDADEEQLPYRLRQMVQLVKAEEGIRIHWAQLLDDLLYWNHDERRVQQRWARAFYRTSGAVDRSRGDTETRESAEGA